MASITARSQADFTKRDRPWTSSDQDDSRYDQIRSIFNGMIGKHPAVIARSAAAADVIEALQLARARHLEVAVRAGSHSVAGMCLNDGGLVIDVRPMKQIVVDMRSRQVRLQTLRCG